MQLESDETVVNFPLYASVQPWSSYSVPKRIWQFWHTRNLEPAMRAHVEQLQSAHPEYMYTLMDDAESLSFLRVNFPTEVGQAYEALIPDAYKADLWRLCVLYKAGGIYLDIKYAPVDGTSLRDMGDSSHFARDVNVVVIQTGIHNGVIAAAPGDPRLEAAIKAIVNNVRDKYYGASPLHPTGPNLLVKYVRPHHNDVDMQFVYPLQVRWKANKAPFIKGYTNYRTDQKKTQRVPYYRKLWWGRKIYNHDADIYK